MAPVVPISHDDVTTEVAAEDLDPLIGVTVDGRFRVVSSVGKGAMGRVYRAVQVPLNRAVALKVLDTNYGPGRDEAFRRRFLVEAALTARLSHPNTVRVLDYGYSREGLLFLAMEYLDGETLDRVLAKGALPWRRVLGISQQIARALREAHELGVVHRDLKPSNVMLLNADEDHDFVKVLDFGLVKSFVEGEELEGRAITKQGMLMGSPQYMAPEQGDKNAADPRSDVYSLGVTMFEALTGKLPFAGAQPLEIILKHVHDPVPPVVTPPSLEPAPDTMKAIVAKCLAKSPMDRFQSMDEVLQALQELAAPSPTKETPVVAAPPPAPARGGGQRTLLLIAGFVLAAAGGVGITAMLMNSRHAATAPADSQVVFHVETIPPGATVTYQGNALGTTPLDVHLPPGPEGRTSAEFTLSLPGYLPLTAKAGGSGSRIEMSQTLQRAPEPSAKEAKAKAAAEKAAEKAAAEKAVADKAAAEKEAAEKAPGSKVDDEKAAADRAAVEKALADRAAADRAAAEKAAAEKAEKAAAEKAEKAAKSKSAKDKAAKERAEKAAAEKAAAEKAAAEKAAAEKAAEEKAAAEKEAADRAAKKKHAASKKAPAAAPAPAPTKSSASKLEDDDELVNEFKEDLKRPKP